MFSLVVEYNLSCPVLNASHLAWLHMHIFATVLEMSWYICHSLLSLSLSYVLHRYLSLILPPYLLCSHKIQIAMWVAANPPRRGTYLYTENLRGHKNLGRGYLSVCLPPWTSVLVYSRYSEGTPVSLIIKTANRLAEWRRSLLVFMMHLIGVSAGAPEVLTEFS
jgi:hypothetical protein